MIENSFVLVRYLAILFVFSLYIIEKLQIFWFCHIFALKQLEKDSSYLRRRGRPTRQSSSIDNLFFLQTLVPRSAVLYSTRHRYFFLPPTCCISRPTGQKIRLQDSISVNPRQVFIDNFNQKKNAPLLFLPKLSDSITRPTV